MASPISTASSFVSYADSATRTVTLEKGEADVSGFGAVPYSDVKRLTALPNIVVTTTGLEMISPMIELNYQYRKRPPFDNVKVRQALSCAVDRQFAIDNIFFGFGKPATGAMSSNFEVTGLYSADVSNYNVPNAVEMANILLDEAGLPRKADGTRFEIVHDVLPVRGGMAAFRRVCAAAARQVGIKATLRSRIWRRGRSASTRTTISCSPQISCSTSPIRRSACIANSIPTDPAGDRVRERPAGPRRARTN